MLTSIRIPSRAFVVALALLFAAGPARAQCLISGGTSLCNGPVQLCGPDGLYEYQWTDPAGNPSYDKCLTAALPGVYSLQIFDMYGASFGPCTQLVQGPDPPPCAITGPTTACAGTTVELCGPQGEFGYAWSGPNGFMSSAACIQASAAGTYRLAVRRLTDNCPETACEQTVTFETCRTSENCPRPTSFWKHQCVTDDEESAVSIDPAQFLAIATHVDAGARIFQWADEGAGFCAALHPKPSKLRAKAKRQFAAVCANVCAGELGLPPVAGHPIALDRTTHVATRDGGTTVGEWMAWADARLCELEPLDRGVPSVKETYKRIVREGWQINHGRGIGPVCGGAARDSEDDDAARLAAEDTEEPLATEIAEDETDAPGRAWGTPNPFSAATTVSYVVTGPAPQEVALAVYDLAGRKVSDLAGGSQAPGVHDVQWDGRGADGARVRSGVYFVRGLVGAQRVAGQLALLR